MKKVVLAILDGWGISPEKTGNAIKNAQTPNINNLLSYYPNTNLQASGISVGLPWGKMGNSEVGHLTIGAGKVLYQNLPRVTISIQDKSFFKKEALLSSIQHAKDSGSTIHLMGLLSNGGVHSHINHLYALLEMLKQGGMPKERVLIHVFTDGRDVDPNSGMGFVTELEENIEKEDFPGRVASIMGRYIAMDRNENWDRTQKAYYCLVNGVGIQTSDARTAIQDSYKKGVTDEFIEPILVRDQNGDIGTIKQNDSIIFFNIREDRARQITKSFTLDSFDFFDRGSKIQNLDFTTMVEYEKGLAAKVVFPPEEIKDPLGKLISNAGMKQFRIAETEKYAHVTYFFNGGEETPFPEEHHMLIPSPNVNSYDTTPQMSAEEITEGTVKAIEEGQYDFILVNFANPDMIGHTGNLEAAIKAVEFVDKCVGKIYETIMQNNTVLLVTADHGNAEEMVSLQSGDKITEHSINPVPFILVDPERQYEMPQSLNEKDKPGGILSDIAPTVLEILDLDKPIEMTGTSLLDSI